MIHLHVHTRYSVGDGLSSSEEYAKKAPANSKLAITDHDSMGGILDHQKACHENNIKPIYGVEATIEGWHHLTLLAIDNHGLKNLYSLMRSERSLQDLRKYNEGVIALSGDLMGAIPTSILQGDEEKLNKYLEIYQDIFDDRFYIEIIDYDIHEQKIVNNSLESIDRQSVVTNDVHYADQQDAMAHGVLMCDKLKRRAELDNVLKHNFDGAYLKEINTSENEEYIAEICNVDPSSDKIYLPQFDYPKEYESESDFFRGLIKNSMKQKGLTSQEYIDRAYEEIQIIESMGYVGYFLIVWDFMNFAHRQNIPVGPGRGSGGGSLVAYLLGITNIDPLEYDLIFERFLNPERVSMPDFDIDFCMERRTEVIEYVKEKYGKESVGGICTFGELKSREAWKVAARVLGVPSIKQDAFTKLLPSTTDDENLSDIFDENGNFKENAGGGYEKVELMLSKNPGYRDVNTAARQIEGAFKNVGRHAAGVLISEGKLEEYSPVWNLSQPDAPLEPDHGLDLLSQLSKEDVEEAGLVKFDFLGLKELTVIDYALDLIDEDIDINEIPLDDEKTFNLISTGRTLGVFQISKQGISMFISQLKPNNIEDIIAAIALYRPGPMDYKDGMHLEYSKRKHGISEVKYPHEDLEDVLKETYGIIVYQEQVMKIAQVISGYSFGEADLLRRAVGKKKPKEMKKQKSIFIEGGIENGYEKDVVLDLWEQIKTFSRYGFNRAHSAGYGIIAYQTGWLKANYTAELLAAQMQVRSGDLEKVSELIEDAREFDVEVVEPDVQYAHRDFITRDGKIYAGLLAIKNLNEGVALEIEKHSPYEDLEDLFTSVKFNKKDFDAIVHSGALDSLMGIEDMNERKQKRSDLINQFDRIKTLQERVDSDQLLLMDLDFEFITTEEVMDRRTLLEKEYEFLERYRTGHPVDIYRDDMKSRGVTTIKNVIEPGDYKICGVIKDINEITTYKDDLMAFARVSDETGSMDVTIFPDDYDPELFDTNKVLYIEVDVDYYEDQLNASFEYMEEL